MAITNKLSIVLPSKNEGNSLLKLLPALRTAYPDAEIVIVDDRSSDATAQICREHAVKVISHPYGIGNGAAIKTGARAATHSRIVFMDADGQHGAEDIARLLEKQNEGYDMVVGSRTSAAQASMGRLVANNVYNRLASWIVGHPIDDLTSGFRVVDAAKFRQFIHLLPNGFSYPTTITMAFFRAGYTVGYVPITVSKRVGKSHIRLMRDGARFFVIIFKIGTLYSPLKVFLPVSGGFFLSGLIYYAYTFITHHRFTNMSALLLITSVLVFLIGLMSEQITSLHYKDTEN